MSYNAEHWIGNEPSMAARYRDEENARQGSAELFGALRLQFRHFALKHGVTMKDASLFCMNSEEP